MKTTPIEPAQIDFGDFGDGGDAVPRSPLYDDIYHPQAGALQQARHVFLQGNGLPGRWASRAQFVVLETGFGLGHNFLATWQAWREDPQRCERLFFVSIEKHPLAANDLATAHARSALPDLAAQLLAAWPPLVANVHRLVFEGGRVQLLLALGEVAQVLPALRLQADALFLDGFAPARNPAMWELRVIKALAAHAAPGASAATWSAAQALRAHLASAGFVPRLAAGSGGKRDITLADYAPRHTPHRLPGCAVAGRRAVVVGAGLAGAATAQALAQAGWQVTVLERHAAPAQEASGNPGGLFHGTVNADDGPYARLFRAAALQAHAVHAAAVAKGVPGAAQGLLRLDARAGGLPALRAMLARTGLPATYVAVLSAEEASACAGLPMPAPAWHYPTGGWVEPAAWVRWALATPGVQLRAGVAVQRLQRAPASEDAKPAPWQLLDADGRLLAEADAVVLCNAAQAQALLAPLRGPNEPPWPLRHTRGQVTQFAAAHPLRLPVAGDGYAIPLPGAVLCGATREAGEPGDPTLRDQDHQHNLERLQRLTGLQPEATAALSGRTGWRLHTDDRLPICGALPALQRPAGPRGDQARLLPREPGLFVLTALGARGLTLAPLLAQLVAAQASGTPWPLEQDLVDAIDPGRWQVRAARMAAGGAGPATADPSAD